jgi:hypothetical protein
LLLERPFEARKDLKKRLGETYALRSKVVHGGGHLKESDYPRRQEALSIAIDAIRALVTERTELLELPDGAARSNALLMRTFPCSMIHTDGSSEGSDSRKVCADCLNWEFESSRLKTTMGESASSDRFTKRPLASEHLHDT